MKTRFTDMEKANKNQAQTSQLAEYQRTRQWQQEFLETLAVSDDREWIFHLLDLLSEYRDNKLVVPNLCRLLNKTIKQGASTTEDIHDISAVVTLISFLTEMLNLFAVFDGISNYSEQAEDVKLGAEVKP